MISVEGLWWVRYCSIFWCEDLLEILSSCATYLFYMMQRVVWWCWANYLSFGDFLLFCGLILALPHSLLLSSMNSFVKFVVSKSGGEEVGLGCLNSLQILAFCAIGEKVSYIWLAGWISFQFASRLPCLLWWNSWHSNMYVYAPAWAFLFWGFTMSSHSCCFWIGFLIGESLEMVHDLADFYSSLEGISADPLACCFSLFAHYFHHFILRGFLLTSLVFNMAGT